VRYTCRVSVGKGTLNPDLIRSELIMLDLVPAVFRIWHTFRVIGWGLLWGIRYM